MWPQHQYGNVVRHASGSVDQFNMSEYIPIYNHKLGVLDSAFIF